MFVRLSTYPSICLKYFVCIYVCECIFENLLKYIADRPLKTFCKIKRAHSILFGALSIAKQPYNLDGIFKCHQGWDM